MPRWGSIPLVLLTAALCVGCDGYQAFFIQNDTDEIHYARVTVNRTGAVYVHQVDRHVSGYASRGLVPGGNYDGDAFALELLDATCAPIGEWSMPDSGGYLRIADPPEFVRGMYPADASPEPSIPSNDLQHPTVMTCGATDTFPEP